MTRAGLVAYGERKNQHCPQPGRIVDELERAAVEVSDRLGEREAEAGAAARARDVEPAEAAAGLGLVGDRDSRAAVRDAEAQPALAHPREQGDLAAVAGIME